MQKADKILRVGGKTPYSNRRTAENGRELRRTAENAGERRRTPGAWFRQMMSANERAVVVEKISLGCFLVC